MKRWLASGHGTVRMVTLAPELPGSEALSDLVAGAGCLVALGHTDADAATFGAALAGDSVSVVTHLFNGMAPMHHREPGPVAASLAALAAGDAHVELIADGTHLADGTIALAFALDPGDRVVLVSDAMGAAGMDDGDYELGTTTVRVIDGTAWTTTEPPSIAGSTVHLADVVRRCITETGIDPVRVVRAATAHPGAAPRTERPRSARNRPPRRPRDPRRRLAGRPASFEAGSRSRDRDGDTEPRLRHHLRDPGAGPG